jgi:alpha-ribazole phosphatase
LQEKKKQAKLPVPELLFTSPLKRCLQTAEILYPGLKPQCIPLLCEFNFGIFENKNYKELSDCPEYQAWVDGFCQGPVPQGEDMASFKKRICRGFLEVVNLCWESDIQSAALVVHGGTIMSILETYEPSGKSYYDWHTGNGEGYLIELDPERFEESKRLSVLERI